MDAPQPSQPLSPEEARRYSGLSPFQLKDELIRWADMIDSAAFPSAEMAVNRTEPVLHLMTVVEHKGTDAYLRR